MELLEQENKRKEMEECTFAPVTISRPGERRNFDQFLEDQRRAEEQKQIKKNEILEEESRQEGREVHHPAICKKSEKLLTGKREGPVHDRLYDISKDRMTKNIRKMMDTPDTSTISLVDSPTKEEATFAPKINTKSREIVRDRPVQDLLYDDAMRRNDA